MTEWNVVQNTVNGRQGDDEREDEGAREVERATEKRRQSQSEKSGGGND